MNGSQCNLMKVIDVNFEKKTAVIFIFSLPPPQKKSKQCVIETINLSLCIAILDYYIPENVFKILKKK